MGKVVPFKRVRTKRPALAARAVDVDPLFERVFDLTFGTMSEEQQRAELARIGESYGAMIRRRFGEKDAAHFLRVFCGGVRNGGAA